MNCIILKGSGEKAFCAGGDVKGVVQQIMRGEQEEAIRHANVQCCLAPNQRLQHALRSLLYHQNSPCLSHLLFEFIMLTVWYCLGEMYPQSC